MTDLNSITVQQFATLWVSQPKFAPPPDAILHVGDISGVTLYRHGPFQVQLFIAKPGATAPRHSHPNIDSCEWLVAGAVDFQTERQSWVNAWPKTFFLHIQPGETHVADAGPAGVCFLSFQKWLNGVEPSSVTLDWDGAAIDVGHADQLQRKEPA